MMKDSELLAQVQQLSKSHYDREISFAEYRRLRNSLLKKIDAEYNGKS